ncbi:uncharacterized protein KY384_005997 [Bacidia gigantensis]|uniref:uncharacterized protein n=1 Tax=Bacidia gigantensis TaxID=2732470 RepID=UPI001D04A288|nr:uncharacterized protein KY384_005997 [Bacidia gigantensis]KAG8529361.1 hypothetical protein KY384_005997 [Bacidia gigantensis]
MAYEPTIEHLSDDDGFMSAESSFYGGDEARQDLEARAGAFDSSSYWAFHKFQPSVIAFQATQRSMASPREGEQYNIYADYPSGRQLDETVSDFLARLPPRTSQIADSGPWIYISNPQVKREALHENIRRFKERGAELLSTFGQAKDQIENSAGWKTNSVIGRQIAPLRRQLEKNIFALARETGVTAGKWMLFPAPEDVDRIWSLIAHATVEGTLGHAAKVAADDGSGDRSRLICSYNEDFADMQAVKRVLQQLDRMGLVKQRGPMGEERGIYYKTDAFTWLEINSGNQWGLRASMFSSKDVLNDGWEH